MQFDSEIRAILERAVVALRSNNSLTMELSRNAILSALATPAPAVVPDASKAVVGEASGQTPALKRHALEAAKRLSEYAAAPFFPNVEVRGIVRPTSAEWWDGLAELIEGSQPLITRALRECTAPIAALSPYREVDATREALALALKALEAISDEMTVGELYTNAGQYLLDALEPARAALAQHQAPGEQP